MAAGGHRLLASAVTAQAVLDARAAFPDSTLGLLMTL